MARTHGQVSPQLELFHTRQDRRCCGNCVVRNALEADELGNCSRHGQRHRLDRPCAQWFGLGELRQPLYGGKKR